MNFKRFPHSQFLSRLKAYAWAVWHVLAAPYGIVLLPPMLDSDDYFVYIDYKSEPNTALRRVSVRTLGYRTE